MVEYRIHVRSSLGHVQVLVEISRHGTHLSLILYHLPILFPELDDLISPSYDASPKTLYFYHLQPAIEYVPSVSTVALLCD